MLAKARPYLGNWIKYCDFADAASQASVIIEPETEEYIQEEPVEIPEPTPIVLLAPEPVVRVSDEFLQLIREEAATINETPGIAPNPDFEAGSETTEANNETSSEYEIVEEVPQLASQPSVALHVVEPIGDERKKDTINNNITDEALISPIYTQDYFLQQGEKVSEEIPGEITELKESADDLDKSLMVMMSFSEWLLHFKSTTRKLEEEKKDQRALKTMWQKEKLAAALEEENEEIPENVFEMAVNSIAKEDGLASESLAEIYIKQGKYDKAMDMYRKLSLRNPQKNAYFARKIEEVLKEKQS
jgi:tetratricopeptide (TPR) repeat protein